MVLRHSHAAEAQLAAALQIALRARRLAET
jgi:hypothetical protein